jgi:hypothetical protein
LGVEKYSGKEILGRIEISTERAGRKETLQLGILAHKPEFILLRQDENLKGTLFAIISTLQGNPIAGGGGRSIAIYGFDKVDADRAGGTYVESTLATAPFPISIEFNGRFEMIKIGPFSNQDVEFRMVQTKAEGKKKQEEESRKFELAPDVPADVPPAPKEQPAVAARRPSASPPRHGRKKWGRGRSPAPFRWAIPTREPLTGSCSCSPRLGPAGAGGRGRRGRRCC